MRKQEVKGKVLDRFPSVYPKSVVSVMVKIIELIKLDDWKRDSIEGKYSQPRDKTKLAFLVNYNRRSVERALEILLHDGFIEESPDTSDSYSVNTSRLFDLPSKFVSKKAAAEAARLKNSQRMRVDRLEKMIAAIKEQNNPKGKQ